MFMTPRIAAITCCALFLLFGSSYTTAETRDVWTELAAKTGSFAPHADNCDSSEVYVAIGGGILGYCIEKDQRASAFWENAKETCASVGKRLPEPAEWIFACKSAPSGLVNMTNGWEWSSNNSYGFIIPANHQTHIVVTLLGYSTCSSAAMGNIASNESGSAGTSASYPYRCVR